jgi:hypothetical protein
MVLDVEETKRTLLARHQSEAASWREDSKQIVSEHGTVPVFGNHGNKATIDSGGN